MKTRRGALVHESLLTPATASTQLLDIIPGELLRDPERALVWADRQGAVEPLDIPTSAYFHARVSPDGARILVDDTRPRGVGGTSSGYGELIDGPLVLAPRTRAERASMNLMAL